MARRGAFSAAASLVRDRSLFLVLAASLAGCATLSDLPGTAPAGFYGPMPLAEPFWSEAPRVVGILLVEAPPGGAYRPDGEGGVSEVTSADRLDGALVKFLESSEADFGWLAADVATLFQDRGFSVDRLDASGVDRALLAEEPSFETRLREFNEVARAAGSAELVLAITPVSWGFSRRTSDLIPLGRRYAFVQVEGMLIDLANRAILWETFSSASVDLPTTWDLRLGGNAAPGEGKLEAGLKEALVQAGESFVHDLAVWDGGDAALVWVGER